MTAGMVRPATILAVLFAVVLVAIPLYDFDRHLYSWHFQQPSFWQGGLELLAIAAILAVCGGMPGGKWKYLLLAVLTEGYLRRHNVDLPLLAAFLFAESLIGLGYAFCRNSEGLRLPTFFIVGASAYVLVSMALSLFWAARMPLLVAFSSVVVAIFYATSFRESLLYQAAGAAKKVFDRERLTRLASVALYVSLMMLAAKAAYRLNYDETWYSLRLAEDLNPNGSFLEDLKLLGSWVHQYPKFFEILLFPLQYFGSFAASKVFSVVVLGIALVAAREIWSDYGLSARKQALMAVVLISIPVVVGDATSAKADFFAGFVFLLSVFYFLKGMNERSGGYMLMSACALVLTLAVKLSAAGYLPVFFLVYAFAAWTLRRELALPGRAHLAMAGLAIAAFCAVTWRTYEITGVPFVSLPDISPTVATLYGWLGFEYKYPYGAVSDPMTDAVRVDSLSLLFKTFLQPTGVRQAFVWITNIAIPFVIMAVLWSFRHKRGRYEALLVSVSFVLVVLLIGFAFNDRELMGGDGNYYLIPMLVIVAVGATAFKWLPQYALPMALLCSIYAAANLPIAFVSSQSWYPGTRGFDMKFGQAPFNREEIKKQMLADYGLADMYPYFSGLDRESCVAMGEGGDALYHLGCRMETAMSIFIARPYLRSSASSFVRMLREKKVSHLVVQNYFPDSYFGRFCRALMDSPAVRVASFRYYNVIDMSLVNDDELMRYADLASVHENALSLDHLVPHAIKSPGNRTGADAVMLDAPKSGIRKYYCSHEAHSGTGARRDRDAEDKVIFIKPDTAIGFAVDTQGRCMAGVEGYFAKHIQNTGREYRGGKFTVTILDGGKTLDEGVFDLERQDQIEGGVPLHGRKEPVRVLVKYTSDGRRLDPNLPAVIANLRVRYCD